MKIISRRLSNGLTVALMPLEGATTITGVFVVRAGWRYETSGIAGVAHFLEHMAFKGTTRRPTPFHIASELDGMGAVYNAFTNEEAILFYIKAPSRHSAKVCDILSDIVCHPLLLPEEIERERGPIHQEYAMHYVEPVLRLCSIELPNLMFGDHPAGWFGIGNDEEIDRVNQDMLRAYLKDLFVGLNGAVTFAGKITDYSALMKKVSSFFGALPFSGERKVKLPYVETQTEPQVRIIGPEMKQTLVAIGIKCPSYSYEYRNALHVLHVILGGGGFSSRLFREIRERRGLAYEIHTSLDLQQDLGIFEVFAGFSFDRWMEGVKVIMEQMRLIRDALVINEELARAKEMIRSQSEMSLEQSDHLARDIGAHWAFTGRIEDPMKMVRDIQRVTPQDVQHAAREVLRNDRLSLVVLGAKQDEKGTIRDIFMI